MPAPTLYFFHLTLRSYNYNMHGAGLLLDSVCLVTLVSSEQSSQFERFRLQHVQKANNTSTFKIKMIGNIS